MATEVPYPRYAPGAAPGENAIGSFVIGSSPIGTIPNLDIFSTIISQYANSPIILSLITNLFDALDQTADFDLFFSNVWNIDTAQGHGLDVLGRIIGVSRTLEVQVGEYFGFSQAVPSVVSWGFGNFYSGQSVTQNYSLTDDAYRVLLFAKAAANICDGSIPAVNGILRTLFPNRGNCFVVDNLDMTATFKFEFSLSPVELAIVGQSGALPTSTGVSYNVDVP